MNGLEKESGIKSKQLPMQIINLWNVVSFLLEYSSLKRFFFMKLTITVMIVSFSETEQSEVVITEYDNKNNLMNSFEIFFL